MLVLLLLPALGVWQARGQTINPTIVINNDTGTNPPAASGAPEAFGPVIPPAECATSGASTTIQSAGHGLGAVPTNGSAAVWMETSSGRRWSKITGVPNGDTFTVQDSFNIAVSVPCVIGGAIAGTLGNITRLCNDLKAGWTVILENTGIPYADSGLCQVSVNFLTQTGNGRLVIRGDDPDNLTEIQYATNSTYFVDSQISGLKLENLHLVKNTGGGTSGVIENVRNVLLKNVRVSNAVGTWSDAWGTLGTAPSVVLNSEFDGPFTTSCGSMDDSDLVVNNFLNGCSGSTSAILNSNAAFISNILDQGGANQSALGGSTNNGWGGVALWNTILNVGANGVLLGTNSSSVISGNLIGEASTNSGACFAGATAASNLMGGSGEPHIIWYGNAANTCPTARYSGGIDATTVGALTDLNSGLQFDPMFTDEGMLDFFPLNIEAKSTLVFPGSAYPFLTGALPVSTMTSGAPQLPGLPGGVAAYAY